MDNIHPKYPKFLTEIIIRVPTTQENQGKPGKNFFLRENSGKNLDFT